MDKVTFYAGEELEFHMGRFYDNLTLEQAINRFKSIEHPMGIKGIGIQTEDSGCWDLLTGHSINVSDLNYVPEIRDLPETKQAIETLKKAFPDFNIE